MLNIVKVIDQWGWAYDFISRDQQKYSEHAIHIVKIEDFNAHDLKDIDVVYFSSPDLSPKVNRDIVLIRRKWPKIKIIGGYAGEVSQTYIDIDFLISISAKYKKTVRQMYPGKPVVWMPEGIDTEYFKRTSPFYPEKFTPGWVGRPCTVKRPEILDQLSYPVLRKQDWGHKHFQKGRTQDDVKAFYEQLSCLLLVSKSECMPRVVLEAMSMELPVISTDVGSLRLLLKPEWLTGIPEDQTIKGANALMKALDMDKNFLMAVGQQNRYIIESQFSWIVLMPHWDLMFNLVNKGYNLPMVADQINKDHMLKYGQYEPNLC